LFSLASQLIGQSNVGINIEADLSVNNTRAYGVASFDQRDKSFSGSSLIWDGFLYSKVLLKGNSKYSEKDYKLAFDARLKTLYLRMHDNDYSFNIDMIDSISVETGIRLREKYVVLKDNEGITDLFRIVIQAKDFSLLEKKKVSFSKQYYNTALDVGELKPKISLSEHLYIHRSGNLFEIPKKRRKFIDEFEDVAEIKDIVSYFKEKKVNFKNHVEVQNALIELNKKK
jgi:hypothetical protein